MAKVNDRNPTKYAPIETQEMILKDIMNRIDNLDRRMEIQETKIEMIEDGQEEQQQTISLMHTAIAKITSKVDILESNNRYEYCRYLCMACFMFLILMLLFKILGI